MSGHRADNNFARRSTDLAETRDRKAPSCVRSGREEAMASLVTRKCEIMKNPPRQGNKTKAEEESNPNVAKRCADLLSKFEFGVAVVFLKTWGTPLNH
jgi:hypothetical protein